MVLTVSFVLSPVIGLFCHRRSADMFLSKPGWADLNSANLTPASGRQDHTILPYAAASFVCSPFDRSQAFRQPALQPRCAPDAAASTASHPASVTIAIRPSGGVGWREFVEMICPTGEAEYFCKGDWTGRITLIRFNKFGFTRKRDPLAKAPYGEEPAQAGVSNHVARGPSFETRASARCSSDNGEAVTRG